MVFVFQILTVLSLHRDHAWTQESSEPAVSLEESGDQAMALTGPTVLSSPISLRVFAFQIVTSPFSFPAANLEPSGEKARELIHHPPSSNVSISLKVLAFQILISSFPPEAIFDESGDQATERTEPLLEWPVSVSISSIVTMFQILTELSSETETSFDESGDHARSVTSSVWPVSVPTNFSVRASQILMVVAQEAIFDESGENTAELIYRACPVNLLSTGKNASVCAAAALQCHAISRKRCMQQRLDDLNRSKSMLD